MATEPRTHIDYTVGWVCALPKELIAAEAMLDETHQDLPRQRNDHNSYTLGRVGVHNVVVACLPKGEIGNNNAATVAARMTSTFPSIKFGLMVGIGGGVPKSVRLGDVVVSTPTDEFGGVVQWDFGKAQQEGFFKRTGALNRPPTELLSALTKIEKEHTMKGSKIPQYLKDLETNWPRLVPKYTRSKSLKDVLFKADCKHIENINTGENEAKYDDSDDEEGYDDEGGENCIHCDQTKIIRRKPRDMRVHYGLIASGNQVIKDALFRDEINKKLGGKVLCFEMEAAGLMNDFPCLVIRGICDYADAHKNKNWQEHAAAVAAAFAKELLLLVPAQEVEQMPTIKQLESRLEGVSDAVNEIRFHQQDHQRHQEHQTIIDWLTPVNYATQQNDFIAQRQQGTGEWVLKSSEFRHWLEQTNQTLFCPGIPGAGKTIITSIVVHHLHDQFQNNPSVGIAYLYCNFKQQDEQRPVDLIINLLKQLVLGQSTIPEAVRGLYNRHKPKQTRPSLNEIRNTLHQVAALYSRTFLVLDALDECRAAPDGRDMLIREIFDFQANTKANLFATSRLIQEIEAKFQRAVRLEIRANDTDVQRYLHNKLQNCPSLISQNNSLQEEIEKKITRAVDGMFLLARLYVDSLACKTTAKAIKGALQELESTSEATSDEKRSKALDNAYEQAMQRIQGQVQEHQVLAKQVLSWISCAKRRLTSAELQHAIGVEENTSEFDRDNIADIGLIVSVCAGLVIVDKESDIIRLAHYTTQEYFERTWEHWFPNAHIDMTKVCTTYLSFEVFEEGYCLTKDALMERLQSHILYSYASKNWGYHAGKSFIEGESLILNLLEDTAKVSACSQAMFYKEPRWFDFVTETAMTGLHLAAHFGLWKPASILLDKNVNVESQDKGGQTPLSLAASKGHEAVVKLLLEKNANTECQTDGGWTPLLFAAWSGHEAVVKLLLEKNANIESQDDGGSTPLLLAAENGHEAVVKLLLEKNANIESQNKYGETPLLFAAIKGHEAVLKLLLEKNANIESQNKYGQNPLLFAAIKGHGAVVKLLLQKNANTESQDRDGWTPLLFAAWSGHEAVVKLLLEKNANIESQNKYGRTPLLLAARRGCEAVVRLLLEKNANIESQNKYSQTPLLLAADNGHEAVVKLLLEKNANIESQNKYGETPLSLAAWKGHEAVVKLLVEKNANIESQNKYGETPLLLAARRGCEAVVKLLLEKNADIESQNKYSQTPLLVAASKGHEAVVRLLLEKNANIESQNKYGETPLSLAASEGHEVVVKLLLEKNANIESQNSS